MSYYTHNGKLITQNNKLVVSSQIEASIEVLDFDANSYITFPSYVDMSGISGEVTVSWNMFLDVSDFGYTYSMILANSNGVLNKNRLNWFITDTRLIIDNGFGGGINNVAVDISGVANQNILVEMVLYPGPQVLDVSTIKFNGVPQVLTDPGMNFGEAQDFTIGAYNNAGSIINGTIMNNMTVWDITFPTIGHWAGYPAGNMNSAWVDTIGTNDGSVVGSPGTRNIII
jgi:hypothetical protein